MRAIFYTTLQGKKLDLKKLDKAQKRLLRKFYKLYQKGYNYSDFYNKTQSDNSLAIMGASYWINKKVSVSTIFQLLNDLADRLALKQEFLKRGRNSNADFTENKKVLKKFLEL